MTELEFVHAQLAKARCPEDIFGADFRMVSALFKDLAKVVHPDRNPAQPALAATAFQQLNQLKAEAESRHRAGTFGLRLPLPGCLPLQIGAYTVDRKPAVGDIADIYTVSGGHSILKIARHADDNDLLRAEAATLSVLNKAMRPPVRGGIPSVLGVFRVHDAGGRPRQVNVLTGFPHWRTAQQVHAQVASLDPRTAVWLFKRLLVLLEYVHHAGLLHGAILPPHVLLYPDNDGNDNTRDPRKHTIRLIDWCYSVDYRARTRLSSWVPQWKAFYPPELVDKTALSPTSDLFMAAQLVQYLCDRLPPPLTVILEQCTHSNPTHRPSNAGQIFEAWNNAATLVYGPPRWVAFTLPEIDL